MQELMNTNMSTTTMRMFSSSQEEDIAELRRGPWTLEEDNMLSHYIARHGEGRWNMLAKSAGLRRTGKSCRLRWLNYLKPDIKRGNLTPHEQLLILELHSKMGNRWSKIAQHLPGRTDNEIKNYWRTRVQRQARQLNIESNSKSFLEAIRCFWAPRLLQKMEQSSSSSSSPSPPSSSFTDTPMNSHSFVSPMPYQLDQQMVPPPGTIEECSSYVKTSQQPELLEDPASAFHSFDSTMYNDTTIPLGDSYYVDFDRESLQQAPMGAMEGFSDISASDCQMSESEWSMNNMGDSLWDIDEIWQLRALEEMGI